QTLALVSMVATAVGGVAWVLLYPILSGERQAERRRASVARPEPMAMRTSRTPQPSTREPVAETLKEIEVRARKPKNPPLSMKIAQAGLSWSKRKFVIGAAVLGVLAFLGLTIWGIGLLPSLAVGFAASAGLPLWALTFLKKRRE